MDKFGNWLTQEINKKGNSIRLLGYSTAAFASGGVTTKLIGSALNMRTPPYFRILATSFAISVVLNTPMLIFDLVDINEKKYKKT